MNCDNLLKSNINNMTHNYKITGMTGDDNREKVKKSLNAIDGVSAVATLDPPLATITMQKHIPTEKLQKALSAAGDYTLEMARNA